MKISTHKAIWWWVTAGCTGGTLFFVLICLDEGPPRLSGTEIFFYLWPLFSVLGVAAGAFRLRALYRREPFAGPGLWQLRLTDLLVVSGFAGLVLAYFHSVHPENLLMVGVPVALAVSVALVLGILTGVRRGISNSRNAFVYGLGWTCKVFGGFCVGSIVITSIVFLIAKAPGRAADFIAAILGLVPAGQFGSEWPILIFRAGLLALPVGFAACWLATRGLPTELPPPEKDRVTSSPPDGTKGGA